MRPREMIIHLHSLYVSLLLADLILSMSHFSVHRIVVCMERDLARI
uniref:Uncharacterized protein n=1 Tax=Rhizophora mucronata TaxID=61149 RepID=A0A2P2NG57_RHIMU